jgi:hypothetical protein
MQSLQNLIRNPGGVTKIWNWNQVDPAHGRRERPHKVNKASWTGEGGPLVGPKAQQRPSCTHPDRPELTQLIHHHTHSPQLMLRHNKITGARFVVLDGVEVPGSRGTTSLLAAVDITFKVGA